MTAFDGHKTCRKHGDYIGYRCPVCEGADHGGKPNLHDKARYAELVESGMVYEDDDWTG